MDDFIPFIHLTDRIKYRQIKGKYLQGSYIDIICVCFWHWQVKKSRMTIDCENVGIFRSDRRNLWVHELNDYSGEHTLYCNSHRENEKKINFRVHSSSQHEYDFEWSVWIPKLVFHSLILFLRINKMESPKISFSQG